MYAAKIREIRLAKLARCLIGIRVTMRGNGLVSGYFQLTASLSTGRPARSPVCVVLCLVISSNISFQIVIRGHFLLIRVVFRVCCCLTGLHRPV